MDRPKRRALAAIFAAWLGVALLAAACGGGDEGQQTPSPANTPSVSEAGAKLTVNSTSDVDQRDDVLTLREAILLATGQLGPSQLKRDEQSQVEGEAGRDRRDTIAFDESLFSPEKPGMISLESSLPPLSSGGDSVDGTGRGAVLDGSGGSEITCISLGSDDNTVRGLRFQNCRTAIRVEVGVAAGNVIGGAELGQGNVLSGNVVGVELGGQRTVIQGNIIGLDYTGTTPASNKFEGIWIRAEARDNVIGGARQGEGNIIAGNELFGVSIDGAMGTTVQGNTVGLDSTGRKAVENKYGIVVQAGAQGNLIGGSGEGERNVVAGNNTGILIRDATTTGNTVRGNYIGTSADGTEEVPNVVDVWFLSAGEGNLLESSHSLKPLKTRESSR